MINFSGFLKRAVYLIGIMDHRGTAPVAATEPPPPEPPPQTQDLPPGAVANFRVTAFTDTSVALAWTANIEPDVSFYRVYQSTDGVTFNLVAAIGGTQCTASGLTQQTTYYFKIAARDAIQDGPLSAPVIQQTATTITPPPPDLPPLAVTGLMITAFSETTVSLSWTASTETDVASYRVYQSTNGVNYTRVATGLTATAYMAVGLTSKVTYFFRVAAFDAIQEGALSAVVSQTLPDLTVTAPTGLTVTAFNDNSVALDWADSPDSDFAFFRLYHSTDGLNYSLLASPTVSTYTALGLTLATHYFKVSAVDTSGNESTQTPAVAQTTIDTTAPDAPTFLQVLGQTETSIQLGWSANAEPDIGAYRMYFSANGTTFVSRTISGTVTLTYLETGLAPFTTYYFKLTALDTAGNESPFTSVVTGTTLPVDVAPAVPSGVKATQLTANSAVISWNANTELDFLKYNTYNSTDGVNYSLYRTVLAPSMTEAGLPLDKRFYYKVTAVDNALHESAMSSAVSVLTSSFTMYDASFRSGIATNTISLLPSHLDPLEAGDKFRLNGTITPAGAYTLNTIADGGYLKITFLPQTTAPTYPSQLVGAQSTLSVAGALTLTAPAGVTAGGTWYLFAMASSFGASDTVTVEPPGYTSLLSLPGPEMRVWGRVATATSADNAVMTWSSGVNFRGGFIVAVKCPGGWPANPVLDSGGGTNSALTGLRYQGLVAGAVNSYCFQLSWKGINDSTANPVTAVTVTSGYTAAGTVIVNGVNKFVQACQSIDNPTGAALTLNDVLTTGNVDSGGSRRVSFRVKGTGGATIYLPVTIPLLRHKATGTGGEADPVDGQFWGDTRYNVIANPEF